MISTTFHDCDQSHAGAVSRVSILSRPLRDGTHCANAQRRLSVRIRAHAFVYGQCVVCGVVVIGVQSHDVVQTLLLAGGLAIVYAPHDSTSLADDSGRICAYRQYPHVTFSTEQFASRRVSLCAKANQKSDAACLENEKMLLFTQVLSSFIVRLCLFFT